MPCFLLLVGLSAALSLTSQRQRGMSRTALLGRCLQRAGEWPPGTSPSSEEHTTWGNASSGAALALQAAIEKEVVEYLMWLHAWGFLFYFVLARPGAWRDEKG